MQQCDSQPTHELGLQALLHQTHWERTWRTKSHPMVAQGLVHEDSALSVTSIMHKPVNYFFRFTYFFSFVTNDG